MTRLTPFRFIVLSTILLSIALSRSGAQNYFNTSATVEGPLNACGSDTGSGNSYACANPAGQTIKAYKTGAFYIVKATHANTGAATLAIDGLLPSVTIKKRGSLDLESGDITSGMTFEVFYDGTYFQLATPVGNAPVTKTPCTRAVTGTTDTLTTADNSCVLTYNNASAITLTVPSGLGSGFNCLIVQLGAGQVTPTASSTTIHQASSYTKTRAQYSVATLLSYTADTFVLSGDLQ